MKNIAIYDSVVYKNAPNVVVESFNVSSVSLLSVLKFINLV